MKKKSKGRGKGEGKAGPVGQMVNSGNGNGKSHLKYRFDTLEKGATLTVPNAEGKAGGVTVQENVRRLAYEFGKRSGMEFEVKKKRSRVICTRIK